MANIIPIRDLKNTTAISELCHKSEGPIFVTKNGYGDMVLMSMEVYERMMERLEVYRSVLISEKEIHQGKTTLATDTINSIKEKYDL